MADLITSDRAKQAINQTTFTEAEDAQIASLVSAVSAAVERWCRRTLASTSHDEYHDGQADPALDLLLLNQYPVSAIAGVTDQGTALAESEYTLVADLGILRRECGWPGGYRRYRVQYTAGYATLPEEVQEATAQWVAALFWQTKDNPAAYPETPTGTVRSLLAPYRSFPLGVSSCRV